MSLLADLSDVEQTRPVESAAVPATAAQSKVLAATSAVSASALLVSVINWLTSLYLAHRLSPSHYSTYATIAAVLVVAGTILAAGAPALLTIELSRSGSSKVLLRKAQLAHLPTLALVTLGSGLLAWRTGGVRLALVTVATSLVVGLLALLTARVIGHGRFGLFVGLRLLESGTRAGLTVLAVVLGLRALGAVSAIGAGSLAAALLALVALGASRQSRRRTSPTSAPSPFSAAAVSSAVLLTGLVVAIGSIDVLTAATAGWGSAIGGYQTINMLGRLPLYVGTALALVALNALGKKSTGAAGLARMGALVTVLLSAAVVATPSSLVRMLFPASAARQFTSLIVPQTIGSIGAALTTILASGLLVAGVKRRHLLRLVVALLLGAACSYAGYRFFGSRGLAWGSATGAWAAALYLAASLRVFSTMLRSLGLALVCCSPLLAAALFGAGLLAAALAGLVSGFLVLAVLRQVPVFEPAARPGGLRILHLAFEDHRAPNPGGGSRRTFEIDRRLAACHEVVVITAPYPGSAPRQEEGISFSTVGPRLGFISSRPKLAGLCYLLALPFVLRRLVRQLDPDVIIEDFAVPFSSVAIPLFTRRPVVGVVQWLFAKEKRAEYRLPFDLIEARTVKTHSTMIGVSAALAEELSRRVPSARVFSVPNALEDAATPALSRPPVVGQDIVYLGRLERAQKGLDVLLDAFESAVKQGLTAKLLVAGTGPDQDWFDAEVRARHLSEHIERLGAVHGEAKFDLLHAARLVVVPSRYETFGIVALEAMAAGSAVIATDDGPLSEVVDNCGVIVERANVEALASAMLALYDDPAECLRLGQLGQARAATFTWDKAAAATEAVLQDAAARFRPLVKADYARTQIAAVASSPGPHLVIGNFGNGNLGDNALGEGFLAAYRAAGGQLASLTVAQMGPVSWSAPVRSVRLRSVDFVETLLKAKTISVVAGGMLGAGMPMTVRALMYVLAKKAEHGDTVHFLAASLSRGIDGPTRRFITQASTSWSFRDEGSARRAAEIGLGTGPLQLTNDLATLLDAPAPRPRAGLLLSMKAMGSATETDQAVELMAHAVRRAAEQGLSVSAISLGVAGDFGQGAVSSDAGLAELVAAKAGVAITQLEATNVKEVLGHLAAAELVIGMRLHAAILATVTSTPVLSLSAETKTASWCELNGLPVLDPSASTTELNQVLDRLLATCVPSLS